MTLLRQTRQTIDDATRDRINRLRSLYTINELEDAFCTRKLDEEFYEIGRALLSNSAARTTCVWTGFELAVGSKRLDRKFEGLAA